MVIENLAEVEKRICAACERAGRSRDEVTLIAVSKTKPVWMLKEVYDLGICQFGENKVQELMDKYSVLPPDINWHMIGHLQRNKVKYIIDKAALIHSVDSLRLADMIEAEAAKRQITVNVLLEVNIAREETKYGLMPEEVIRTAESFANYKNICVQGLMTIAPFVENPEENREKDKIRV